jgi:hypothetical protein
MGLGYKPIVQVTSESKQLADITDFKERRYLEEKKPSKTSPLRISSGRSSPPTALAPESPRI